MTCFYYNSHRRYVGQLLFDYDRGQLEGRGHVLVKFPFDVSASPGESGFCLWSDGPAPSYLDASLRSEWQECSLLDAHFVAPGEDDEAFYHFTIKPIRPRTRFEKMAERFL